MAIQKILIVDDSPTERYYLTDILTRNGFTVASADSGEQALEKIKASGKSTIYTPTAAESNEWKKALMPVHKEMENRVGKATIEAAYKAADEIGAMEAVLETLRAVEAKERLL